MDALGLDFAKKKKKKKKRKKKTRKIRFWPQESVFGSDPQNKNPQPHSVAKVILSDPVAGSMGCNFAFVDIRGNYN